jgi:hypothetical protein
VEPEARGRSQGRGGAGGEEAPGEESSKAVAAAAWERSSWAGLAPEVAPRPCKTPAASETRFLAVAVD